MNTLFFSPKSNSSFTENSENIDRIISKLFTFLILTWEWLLSKRKNCFLLSSTKLKLLNKYHFVLLFNHQLPFPFKRNDSNKHDPDKTGCDIIPLSWVNTLRISIIL